ncbi:hypothetical protein BC832DRAFT_531398 [Gaertneriomyces semiglobifer]|nr:hypothetical protein BC832DRAFT_531398 [Gaertneriomyces semiglobifer]
MSTNYISPPVSPPSTRRPSNDSISSGLTSTTVNPLPPRRATAGSNNGSNTPTVIGDSGLESSPPSMDRLIMHTTPRRSSVDNTEARLVFTNKFGGTTDLPLLREETTIGRKDDNHIALPCAKISKYHAVVKRGEQGFYLRDRNSANGIKVNDKLVLKNVPHLLQSGDKIDIGTLSQLSPNSYYSPSLDRRRSGSLTDKEYRWTKLVTILPSEQKYEETVSIRAEMDAEVIQDFRRSDEVDDVNTLREDYEKLRLTYELSKVFSLNITEALSKSCELIFELLPVDRAVVLLVDDETRMLSTHYVRVREGKGFDQKEICLSSTILKKVYHSRKCLITSDACEDPMLSKQASVKVGQIRSVCCLPLIAQNRVLGILHLDSRDRISTFSPKDVSLIKTICSQTAMAIQNSWLVQEMETKARLTENLSRFLPPHVVSKMTTKGEVIRKGSRETIGTVLFADIRGFTQLSEKSSCSEVVSLLNDYFERLVGIVFNHNGIVDKYIGDALMAAFGTLEASDNDHPEYDAVRAALDFKLAIAAMNEQRARQKLVPISIGVGLNTGPLLTGFIGCSQRLEYTCIGDTVNTSSRICSMADKDQVLISESTYEKIRGRIECRQVGFRQFKGKEQQVMVYEALTVLD